MISTTGKRPRRKRKVGIDGRCRLSSPPFRMVKLNIQKHESIEDDIKYMPLLVAFYVRYRGV